MQRPGDLFVLLGIGLVHAFLIWVGDILIIYALLGFLLIPFRKAKPRTRLIWVAILLALPLLFNAATTVLVELGRAMPDSAAQLEQTFAEVKAGYLTDTERANRTYSNGNFLEIIAQRAYDYSNMGLISIFALGFNILAMFLIGAYSGKREIFHNLEAHRRLFRNVLLWGGTLGLAGNALYATQIMQVSRFESSWALLLATIAQSVGAPLLCFAYVSAFCLLALAPG